MKNRILKNLLVFSQKSDDLTIFFIGSLRTEGKEAKTALSGPDDLAAKIGHVGVYFAKMGCKIEDGFTDIFGFRLWYLVPGRRGILADFNTQLAYKFCSQKKNG